MSNVDAMIKDVDAHRPKKGFNVCGIDDFELPGEQVYFIKSFDSESEAKKFAKTRKDKVIIIKAVKG